VQWVLHTLIIVSLVSLFLISLWLSYQQRLRARDRRLTVVEHSSNRRFYKRVNRDPEEQYIEGVGYVIGDLSCAYNAKSPYIRCAVNPDGLCQDCRHYHQKDGDKL
jgi:Family of unknown function (DUF6464)